MSETLIQTHQLVKTYGNGTKRVEVLKGIDLLVQGGQRDLGQLPVVAQRLQQRRQRMIVPDLPGTARADDE